MYINFAPELFIEVIEMTRFKESLDDQGFRKTLLTDSVNFGLIKSARDIVFSNARVERDVDNALNQKTIKIGAIGAINNDGLFISSPQINNFSIPSDSNWYWIKIQHQYSTLEKGNVTIDATGNLTGVGTEFTKVLRSNQNFPSLIRFTNSIGNTLDGYEVADIIDDNHCIIVHPAISAGGTADFYAETNLRYEIIGTFTEGPAIPNDSKRPFRYDSCLVTLVQEVTANIRPTYQVGQEFYIARVKVSSGNLVIQDKRTDYWETKGSKKVIDIETAPNPLIGVEAVRWQNSFNTSDRNIVDIAWGMRSTNWSVDSSQNIVTFLGSSLGGSFKTTDDFTDGSFNGQRLYTSNGKYSKVVNSIKQGSAINLYLDILDVDNFSTDGGLTFTGDQLLVVPDAESIEIAFLPQASENLYNITENDKFSFNINAPIGKCSPTVFADPTCKYIVLYRYKSLKEFTKWTPIKSGSYFTERSFEQNGALKISTERVTYTYTSDPVNAFIQLEISPKSWKKFKETVYKGDIIGVNTISSFAAGQVLELKVAIDKKYQHVTGSISLGNDVYISLSRLGAVEGNQFKLHFDCTTLNMAGKRFLICDDYSSGTLNILKQFSQSDAFQMMNQDGGIAFDITFDNTGKWIISQNYDLGQPFETKIFDVSAADLHNYFDLGSGKGIAKGYYGWQLHSVLNAGRTPVGFGVFIDPNTGVVYDFSVIGATGGEAAHTQTENELAKHKHFTFSDEGTGDKHPGSTNQASWSSIRRNGNQDYDLCKSSKDATIALSSATGSSQPMNVLQPYYVTVFVKKTY